VKWSPFIMMHSNSKKSNPDLIEKINQLQTLQNLSTVFQDTRDLKSVFHKVYDFFPQHLAQHHFQRINLMVYDEKLNGLISDPYIGIHRFGRKAQPQPIGYSISGICYKENKPIYISDCNKTDLIPAKYIKELKLKSVLALPLHSHNQVIGIIRFDNIRQIDAFSQNDIDFLSLVANNLSVVFQNAILFENQTQSELLNHILYEISKVVLNTDTLEELYIFIHQSIQQLLDCKIFYIASVNSTHNALEFPYSVDDKTGSSQLQSISLDDDKSLSVEVLKTKKPLLLNELELQNRYKNRQNKVYGATPKCWMGVPLFLHNQIIGIMAVQSYEEPFAYSLKDVALFESLATQIAVAIDRINTENALKDSELKYRMIVEHSNDAIVVSQSDKLIYFNQAFADLLKYDKNELIGADYHKIHTEEAVRVLENRQARRNRGEEVPNRYETLFRQKDGTEVPVEANVRIIDYKGQKATFAVIRDISKQKKMMAALQETAEQSTHLKNLIPICAGCNKIRDDEKEGKPWVSPPEYITERLPHVNFSHGMCPDCMQKWYPDYMAEKIQMIK